MAHRDELSAFEPELRALAGHLVSDPEQAEEALQETYLSALDARPDEDRGTQGWLRRILRSKARQVARREARRRRLEHGLPPGLSDPGSERDGERKRAFLRQLAHELERLREPYRSTLRERFRAGVAPPELARREGVPVRTIHTRISRGLALLREALERRVGRPSWQVLWLALVRPRARWAAAVLVVLGALAVFEFSPRRAQASALVLDAPAARVPATVPASLTAPRAAAREPVETSGHGQPAPEVATRALPAHAGRVVDLDGRGVAGLEVAFEVGVVDAGPLERLDFRFVSGERLLASTHSGPDGAFELAFDPAVRGRVAARGPAHRTVAAELFHGQTDGMPLEVVVAPLAPLAGRVRDAAGEPVAGARIALRPSEAFLARRGARIGSWLPSVLEVESAADGAFRLDEAWEMPGARLEVRAPGFVEQSHVLAGERVLEVVLARARASADLLPGRLTDEGGAPRAGGTVIAAGRMLTTDPEGRFALERAALAPQETVWGFAPGRMPARVTLDPAASALELRIGPPAARITGRVEDEHGRAVANAIVWTIDPTLVGRDLSTWFAETHVNGDRHAPIPFYVTSDAEGRFELPFLLARAYRLGALERESFVVAHSAPIEAGAREVVLRLPAVARAPVLGRVVDARGAPLVGAEVGVGRAMVQVLDPDGRTLTSTIRGPSTRTDEDGWFGLPPLPEDDCLLDVTAEGCFAASRALPHGAERDYVEVVVARRAPLEVSWTQHPGPLTHFVVLAANGRMLDLVPASVLDRDQGIVPQARVALVHGSALLVVAPDTATTLVAFDGEREALRLPLAWQPGHTTRIDL